MRLMRLGRTTSLLLAAFVAALGVRAAGVARPGTPDPPPIAYHLSVPNPVHRELEVEMVVAALDGPLDARMSRTSPGRYAVHEFARNVFDVRAADGAGRPLRVDHLEPNRWVVGGHDGTVRLRYRVFGDRLDGTYLSVGPAHAHVNPPAALLWPADLDRAATVRLDVPPGSGWRVATQLPRGHVEGTWIADTLAFLMDSPIEASRHAARTFDADLPTPDSGGPPPSITVVLHHPGRDDEIEPIVEGLRRIVRTEAAVFGEYPKFEDGRYTFLLDFLPWALGDGMEHRNSTVITGSSAGELLRRQALETAAHEFFHAWNVERIRPRTLEPFDFERPAVSSELWLAEGFTSYYQDLTLARARLVPFEQTLRSLQASVDALAASPALAYRSAAEMSRMASLVDGANPAQPTNLPGTFLSYYTHGHALAIGFDLAIRERTGSRRSLDDFMRAMWHAHGRPGGVRQGFVDAPYTMDDVRARLAEVTGDRAFGDALVSRFVEGRERMDYARLLATAGLVLRPLRPGRPSLGAVPLQPTGDGLRLGSTPPHGSPLHLAGLGQDDEIVSIDGKVIDSPAAVDRALARLAPGVTIPVRFARRGEPEQTTRVTLVEDPALEIVPIERTGRALGDAARRVRDAWLGAAGDPRPAPSP
jgi:predicted metalloprotease with PDZ domain